MSTYESLLVVRRRRISAHAGAGVGPLASDIRQALRLPPLRGESHRGLPEEPCAMTVWQYAIVCEAARLMRESERRELTPEEWSLLGALMPTVERVEQEEKEGKRYGAAD
jgi:hypothetical protein